MNQYRVGVAVVLAVALVVAACSGDSDGDGEAGPTGPGEPETEFVEGGTATFAVDSDPGSLDPHASVINVNLQMTAFAYDSLVFLTPDGEVVSGLAEEWEDNGTEVVFTLRDGITCSDGSPLTASDVVANFDYVTNPENGSPVLGTAVPPGATATADDAAGTVTLTVEQPFPFLLLSLTAFPIVCADGLADRESLADGTAGTGPYQLSSSTSGQEYTYTVREDYAWGPDGATTSEPGVPAEVVFTVVANETTTTNLLMNGQVNIGQVIAADRQRLEDEGVFNATSPVGLAQMYFNHAEGRPGADEVVRQALAMGINLEEVGQVLTGGFWEAPTDLTSAAPEVCGVDTVADSLPTSDPEAAEELLDEAGWVADGDGVRSKDGQPLRVSFLFNTDIGSGIAPAAELAAEQWREIGADVSLEGNASNVVNATLLDGTGDWDVTWVPVSVSLPSQLVPFYSGPTPPDGLNFGGIANADYEAAVAAASSEPAEGGCPDWAAAETALLESADVVPIADTMVPMWGSRATFDVIGTANMVVPTSVRLVET